MQSPLTASKTTGIILFVMGLTLIAMGVYLHFIIPLALAKLYLLNDSQQHIMKDILSGTIGSLFIGGIIAFGVTDIVIAVGLIKKKHWAVKSLLMLIIAAASLNILTLAGMPSYTTLAITTMGALVDCSLLLYFWKKNKSHIDTPTKSEIVNKT